MAVNEAANLQNRSTGNSTVTNVGPDLLNTCDETDKESSQIKSSLFMQNQDPPSVITMKPHTCLASYLGNSMHQLTI